MRKCNNIKEQSIFLGEVWCLNEQKQRETICDGSGFWAALHAFLSYFLGNSFPSRVYEDPADSWHQWVESTEISKSLWRKEEKKEFMRIDMAKIPRRLKKEEVTKQQSKKKNL